jgi:hypothetical protein
MGKGLWIFILSLVISGCSVRDFSVNDLFTESFEPPEIHIVEQIPGEIYSTTVELKIMVSCKSGVDYVNIQYEDKELYIDNPVKSKIFFINTNISFKSPGYKKVYIYSYSKKGLSSYSEIEFNIQINAPFIWVNDPVSDYLYQLSGSYTFNGGASCSSGDLKEIFIIVKNKNTGNSITNIIPGTNSWVFTAALYANTENNIKFFAVSDFNVQSAPVNKNILVDQQKPLVQMVFPTNNAVTSPAIQGIISASDALTWVPNNQVFFKLDDNTVFAASKSGSDWEFSYSGLTNGGHILKVYCKDFVGNTSLTQTMSFTVDSSLPVVSINGPLLRAQKVVTADITGGASIGSGSIVDVYIKLNNNAWVPSDAFISGASIAWSKVGLVLNMNATNTLIVSAVSDSGVSNLTSVYKIIADNTLPYIVSYNLTNNQVLVNTDYINQNFTAKDGLSGMMIVSNYFICPTKGVLFSSYAGNFTSQLSVLLDTSIPGGDSVTNVLVAVDMAGNIYKKTNIIKVYPAVYVTVGFSDANPGFLTQPIGSIQKGIDIAGSLGIQNVYISMGSYNTVTADYCVNLKNNMKIKGGFIAGFTANDMFLYPTIINGNGLNVHVVKAVNVNNVVLSGLILRGANGAAGLLGGGLFLKDCNQIKITNCYIRNNIAKEGGGVYITNSDVEFNNVQICSNTAEKAPSVLVKHSQLKVKNSLLKDNISALYAGEVFAASFYSLQTTLVVTNSKLIENSMFAPGGIAAEYFMAQICIEGTFNTELINSQFIGTNNLTYSSGDMYLIGIYLKSSPGYLKINNNLFYDKKGLSPNQKTVAIWESVPVAGQILMNNLFYTLHTKWYYDFNTDTFYNNTAQINTPANTGASVSSGNAGY